MQVIDDMSAAELQSVPLSTSERAAYSYSVQGIIDPGHTSANISSVQIGAGAKNSHSEIDHELLVSLVRT